MSGPRRRVFIADDYLPLVKVLTRLLRDDFDVVGSANSVSEMLREVARLLPDVVVLDLNMPETNGIDACRQLRCELPDMKIILVSAADDAWLRTAALKAGASEFVSKAGIGTQLVPALRSLWPS